MNDFGLDLRILSDFEFFLDGQSKRVTVNELHTTLIVECEWNSYQEEELNASDRY